MDGLLQDPLARAVDAGPGSGCPPCSILSRIYIFSPVGFKKNPSLLEICFFPGVSKCKFGVLPKESWPYSPKFRGPGLFSSKGSIPGGNVRLLNPQVILPFFAIVSFQSL